MNKKIIAAAVAGAFVAPVAFAQSSSVQIYGLVNAEYGFASQADISAGNSRGNTDALNSGASRIGFKGEEKLSGGMSAFWQCESQLRFLEGSSVNKVSGGSNSQAGNLCDRNSAIGLKGGFGSVYAGNWDSPLKRVSGMVRMTNETGWSGTQQFTLGNGGTFSYSFSTRNANTINYDTPSFDGFSASLQYTTKNVSKGSNVTTKQDGRAISMSGQYVKGPLTAVVGHTRRDDQSTGLSGNGLSSSTTTSYTLGAKDKATLIGASYSFASVKVGASYAMTETQQSATTTKERKGWNLAADYALGGPGVVRVGYAKAGDSKISSGTGADTGASQVQIGYLHNLSKRTTLSLTHVRLNNDTSGEYTLTGATSGTTSVGGKTTVVAGQDTHATVIGLNHTF